MADKLRLGATVGGHTILHTGNSSETILEPVTKTVGSGKDFETLHLALRWVEQLDFKNNANVSLSLDDGTHVLGGEGESSDWYWTTYRFVESSLSISSASSDKSLCTITLDPFDDGDQGYDLFSFEGGGANFSNITIDLTVGGYLYTTPYPVNGYSGSVVSYSNVDVKNATCGLYIAASRGNVYTANFSNVGHGVLAYSKSNVFTHDVVITDTLTTSARGLDLRNFSTATMMGIYSVSSTIAKMLNGLRIDENSNLFLDNWSSEDTAISITNANVAIMSQGNSTIASEITNQSWTFTDCTTAFEVTYSSKINLLGTTSFTNTTNEYNVPLNEIQYDGSYISDNTVPLIAKDTLITEYVEKTVGAGKDFTTLHSALVWLEGLKTSKKGMISLKLDDGTHTVGPAGQFDIDWGWYYYNLAGVNLLMSSTSGTNTACTITLDPVDESNGNGRLFSKAGGDIRISNLTIDLALGGNPNASTLAIAITSDAAFMNFSSCILKNFSEIISQGESYVRYITCTIDNSTYGLTNNGGRTDIVSSTIQNSDLAVANYYGDVKLDNVTFTNNIQDTNIPLNEIQYDGSFITDGAVPLYHKDHEVITTDVTKTVGTGKDFTTLHEALRWAEKITTRGAGIVNLSLDDGTHVIAPEGGLDQTYWNYYRITSSYLSIKSTSGTKANCIITMDPFDDGDQWPVIFGVQQGGVLSFSDVTVDVSAGGYLYPTNVYTISVARAGFAQVFGADLKNAARGFYCSTGGDAQVAGGSVITNMVKGIECWGPTNTNLDFCSFVDCDEALSVGNSGKIFINTPNVTFTNNTVDALIPFNEIQYGGDVIMDQTGPLHHKDNEIITTSIIKTVGTGRDFVLLHDALRWAEGTTFSAGATLTLALDDSTHVVGGSGEYNTDKNAYYFFDSLGLTIKSISDIKTSCIITMDSFDDGDAFPIVIRSDAALRLKDITIDVTAGGYLYSNSVEFVVLGGSFLSVDGCTIANIWDMYTWMGSTQINNTVFDNAYNAVFATGNTAVRDVEIKNCFLGINASDGSTVVLRGTNTFTTNTTDTNIPLNEIQYNGTFITNGTSAMSFKA